VRVGVFFQSASGSAALGLGTGPWGHVRVIAPFSLGPVAPSYRLFYRPKEGLDAAWIPAKLHHVALSDGIVFRR